MSMRPHGHAKVNARWPEAAAICDRCSHLFNHKNLRWQFEWAGERLLNIRILVCPSCYDKPQEQLRARILGPDPLPIMNARPEPMTTTGVSYDETNYLFSEDEVFMIIAEDGTPIIAEGFISPVGAAPAPIQGPVYTDDGSPVYTDDGRPVWTD